MARQGKARHGKSWPGQAAGCCHVRVVLYLINWLHLLLSYKHLAGLCKQCSAVQLSPTSIWAAWQANICGNRRANAVASRNACSTCCTPAGGCNWKSRKPLQTVNRKSFLIFSATHPSTKVSGACCSAKLGESSRCCCQLIEPIVSFKLGLLICLRLKFGLSARRSERLGSARASSASVGQLRQLQPSLLRLPTRSINWQQLQFSMARRTTIDTECPAILQVCQLALKITGPTDTYHSS